MPSMAEKLEGAAPYNIFYNSIADIEETHNHKNFITFSDLLCPSLGKLKCSVQITNRVEINWLLHEYEKAGYGNIPLTIFYGNKYSEVDTYLENNSHPNVTAHKIIIGELYSGVHGTKLGLYVYEDNSLRIVVSTACVDSFNWTKYTQMIWISPLCKPLTLNSKESDSALFKKSLLQYLNHYPNNLTEEITNYIANADFSNIKVLLVTSVPGYHDLNKYESESHSERMGELLSNHFMFPNEEVTNNSWPILMQASSIGNIGNSQNDYLRPALLRSLDSNILNGKPLNSRAETKIIFPSKQNVRDCIIQDGKPELYLKFCINNYVRYRATLCSWKSEKLNLTKTMPRSKCYCRISPDNKKLGWFLLTSANVTKSSWGGKINRNNQIFVRSYALGVLFLPSFFGKGYFEIDGGNEPFPLIFDIPLSPYKDNEEPFAEMAETCNECF